MTAATIEAVEATLTPAEARSLTEQVKADAQALWDKCLRLYEGGAHIALGYSSWAAYWEAEFGRGKSDAYRVLDAARVVRMLPDSPNGERINEAQARELAPLKDDEQMVVEAYRSAQETAAHWGATLTAEHIRDEVTKLRDKKVEAAVEGRERGLAKQRLPLHMPDDPVRTTDSERSWNYRGAPHTPPKDYAAAVAEHDRFHAVSDALRAKAGLPPVPESYFIREWRTRLESGGAPATPVEKVIACATREQAKASGADRDALDAAIRVLRNGGDR